MTDHEIELQRERGINEEYLRRLTAVLDQIHKAIQENGGITDRYRGVPVPVQPLIGRVALTCPDRELGNDFYVGSGYLAFANSIGGDTTVLSWAAPMAQLFYQGCDAPVDLADRLAARRTFARRGHDIADFEDFLEAGVQAIGVFGDNPTATPTIPAPPRTPVRPRSDRGAGRQSDDIPDDEKVLRLDAQAQRPEAASNTSEIAERGAAHMPVSTPASSTVPLTSLRAPKMVLAAVNAPRTGFVTSLLGTLQPDQYGLVTWPEDEHLIIQGQPGTGKTVIGLHRAAYLTNPERRPDWKRLPTGAVLVIGPTNAYVEHAKPVLDELCANDRALWSLPTFYAELGAIRVPGVPTDGDYLAISSDPLGTTVERARRTYLGPKTPVAFADHLFRCGNEVQYAAAYDEDVLTFLRGAKDHAHASTDARYHPVMALAGLLISGVALADRFRHIVIDEAQDLRPIDLHILRLLVSHGINLTLLGDTNQRRSNFSASSWEEVASLLNITRDDGTTPVITLDVGFRSTRKILQFANRLLPASERRVATIREGTDPRLIRAIDVADVLANARIEALHLQQKTGGLVAIIATQTKQVTDHLRSEKWARTSDGWRPPSWPPTDKGSRRDIAVFDPDSARGLEFDGVVVLEPADFPNLFGRRGSLYTSLTRATKELTIVHAKGLPKELRRG